MVIIGIVRGMRLGLDAGIARRLLVFACGLARWRTAAVGGPAWCGVGESGVVGGKGVSFTGLGEEKGERRWEGRGGVWE